MRLRRAWPWVVVVVVVIGFVGAGLWLDRSGGLAMTGSRRLVLGNLEVTIPAAWWIHDRLPPSSGFGSMIAVVGTLPWGPCEDSDLNCHYEQKLGPGQIEVRFGTVSGFAEEDMCAIGATRSDLMGRRPDDPVATGRLMRVAGRPTLQTDYDVDRKDYYVSDEWRSWRIAPPGTTEAAYTIEALYQGPGVQVFRRQLDDVIASVRFDEDADWAGGDGPVDCGPPFPP